MPKQSGTEEAEETEEAAEECEEEESEEVVASEYNYWDGHVAACQAVNNELARIHDALLSGTELMDRSSKDYEKMLAKFQQRLLKLTDID